MTYFVTALTNDTAQLIVHELRTTDERAADMIALHWEACGFLIVRKVEG